MSLKIKSPKFRSASSFKKPGQLKFTKRIAVRYPDLMDINEFPLLKYHELRHTNGTLLYRSTKDSVLVRDIMGHSNLKTTEKYIHGEDEEKKLQDAVKDLF